MERMSFVILTKYSLLQVRNLIVQYGLAVQYGIILEEKDFFLCEKYCGVYPEL